MESLQAEELLKCFGSDYLPTRNRTSYCMMHRYVLGKLTFRTAHRDVVALKDLNKKANIRLKCGNVRVTNHMDQ